MQLNDFVKGEIVRCRDDEGVVNFICEEYITLTVGKYKKSPEVAEHSINPYNEINVLINNKYWKDCELVTNSQQGNRLADLYHSQEGRYGDAQ